MLIQGASEMETLYFRLYLLCLGYDGFLGGIKDAKGTDPYATLDRQLGYLWEKAYEQYDHEGPSALSEYIDDDDLIYGARQEDFKNEFHALLNRAARRGGYNFDYTQPEELSELVYRLSGYTEGMSVYNPFAGLGSYARKFMAGDSYYGEEIKTVAWGIGVLRMYIDGCASANYINGDSRKPTWDKRFDIVVSTPPYSSSNLLMGRNYTTDLVISLHSILDDGGSSILVSSANNITGRAGRWIRESEMLDMIIVLPDNFMFSTSATQVLIRLKPNRDPGAPVTLVDAQDFFIPGGRQRKTLDTDRILKAIEERDPDHVVSVSSAEIDKNGGRLFPAFYLIKETTVDGQTITPVSELGRIANVRPGNYEREIYVPFVGEKDLSPNPLTKVSPTMTNNRIIQHLRIITEPSLLIARRAGTLYFGYVSECSEERPVYIYENILAFVPNKELTSWEYVAVSLSQSKVSIPGTSRDRLYYPDLALARIPKISKEEQKKVVYEYLEKTLPARKVTASTRKVPVVTVGIKELDDKTGRLNVIKQFDVTREAIDWIIQNPNTVEAVILKVGGTSHISELKASSFCGKAGDLPVYILAPDYDKLEAAFSETDVEYNLKERVFGWGSVDTLIISLLERADLLITPEGRIRQQYEKELEDAASLDGFFKYEIFNLRDELEKLLARIASNDTKDIHTPLRQIRDICFLKPLVDYGFLPNAFSGDGANIDFLVSRFYESGDGGRYILTRQILPGSIAKLLQAASKTVLNPSVHGTQDRGAEDSSIIIACLSILMAALCELARMVDSGLFQDKDSPKGSFTKVYTDRFQSGQYEVKRLEDVKGSDYFYAGNVHLGKEECDKAGIKAGDVVQINRIAPSFEQVPRINDYVQVYFYTKFFTKVPAQDS